MTQNTVVDDTVQTARMAMGKRAAWLALSIGGLSTVLLTLGSLLSYITSRFSDILVYLPLILGFATIGPLIAARRPENLIWWFAGGFSLLGGFSLFAGQYALYTLVTSPDSLPGGVIMAWIGSWTIQLGLGFLGLTLLYFPTGRLLSPRWQPVAWLFVGAIALNSMIVALTPGPLPDPSSFVHNPVGIEGNTVFNFIFSLWDLMPPVLMLPLALSTLLRYRHAKGDERLQLKWFTYAVLLLIVWLGVWTVIDTLQIPIGLTGNLMWFLAWTGIPVSIGIAILKYRLYDIDLIINRTLVYVPLTAILAGVYTASIALSQRIFVAVTGEESVAAIVLTTLVVVSAFTPVKNGLQNIVDRRFKEPPDPTKELRAFGEQVRSFVELSDPHQITRRVLGEAIRAFQAKGGAIYLHKEGQLQLIHTVGERKGKAKISVPLESDGVRYGVVSLGERRYGLGYSEQDREALQQIVSLVAQAIRLAEHTRPDSI